MGKDTVGIQERIECKDGVRQVVGHKNNKHWINSEIILLSLLLTWANDVLRIARPRFAEDIPELVETYMFKPEVVQA
jgi:hypothetical protein